MKTKFNTIRGWTTGSVLLATLIVAFFLVPHTKPSRTTVAPARHSSQQHIPDNATRDKIARSFGQLPLSFEANRGQTAKNVDFVARGGGYTMFLAPTQATLSLKKASASTVLRMNLLGANVNARSSGAEILPGKVNYLLGKDRKKWRTGIQTYRKVLYDEVYRGIDLVYYGQQRQLEYDFVVKPGASPRAIQLGFGGAEKVCLDKSGALILGAKGGQVRWQRPVAYQNVNGARRLVDARYELGKARQNEQCVSFAVGAYDKTRPLIIDPILLYSTYLGGTGDDQARAVAVDRNGYTYIAGETASLDLPRAQNAASGATDAFVTELDPSASQVVFSTYLGGTGNDSARGVAVDSSNRIYLTGNTSSSDFPTQSAQQSTFGGGPFDGFAASLNNAGTGFNYSTYLGGSGADGGNGVAIDSNGNASLVGQTVSPDFPTSASALQSTYGGGNSDAFVTKLDLTGTSVYSTYLGGNGADVGTAITTDSDGTPYVAGATDSNDFPTTSSGAFQPTIAGGTDAFFTLLDTTQTGFGALLYSTYFGGSGNDTALAIATDSDDYAYLTGTTTSTDLPLGNTPAQGSNGGGTDAFVASFDPGSFGPSALLYSTYLGGSGDDAGRGIGVDSSGNAYLTGDTTSSDFPTQNALQSTHAADGGLRDAFASKLDNIGSMLLASTYFGGNGDDSGNALAVGSEGDITLTGVTSSSDLAVSTNATQKTKNAGTDAFVSKLSFGTSLVVINTNDAGAGSLRQALTDANGSEGTDAITFAIPGTGVQTITLASSLPSIDDPIIIDGYSQPGSTPNTLANGTNAQILIDINGNGNSGLLVTTSNCQVRGLVLRNFNSSGAAIEFSRSLSALGAPNQISGCFIGTNADGVTTGVPVGVAPGDGILTTGFIDITIGGSNLADRNLISGNANGVNLASSGNSISNNLIGTQRDGETALPNTESGVVVTNSRSNSIGSNVISSNTGYGVHIQSLAGSLSSFNSVFYNRIGVSATQQALGNGDDGVRCEGANDTYIIGNIIGANGGDGIDIELLGSGGGFFNTIYGNFIGTNAQSSDLGNTGNGIQLGVGVQQNTIGRSGMSGVNVIGFNRGNGIAIQGSSSFPANYNTIINNFIGVAADGGTALPNQSAGISVSNATSTFIGGTGSSDGNVISGNGGNGIQFVDSNYAEIKGNFIGTNATVDRLIPNGGNGIYVVNAGTGVIIGDPNGRNVIDGNGGNGIDLVNTSASFVQSNIIGTSASGNAVFGNGGSGIAVQGNSNLIGGINTGEGNLIGFNGANGVAVGSGSQSNAIRRNEIFENGALGIDEGVVGVTANDTPDSDGVQNFPVITSARTLGGSTRIIGTLSSGGDTDYALDFFSSPFADPSGYGEGRFFIASQTVTTDSAGNATFNFTVPVVPTGSFITATATSSNNNSSEFSQAAAVVTPTFSINGVSIAEGNSGTSNAVFTVTLTPPNTGTVTSTVNFATANGTATAPADYTSTTGTLTFAPGVTTQTISVPIIGDTTVETDETFTVNLSGATNGVIGRAVGTGTITNEDVPSLSINSGNITEGNSGTTNGNFTVTLSQRSPLTVTVDFATADGTATAPSDYSSTSGTLTFAPGTTTHTITVPIVGDTVVEPDETFTVDLSNPVNATISQARGVGTIVNDDVPGFSINDITVNEGDSGINNAVFTVTMSQANTQTSTVNFATADGPASAPDDYTSTSGTLSFAPGVTSQTISVPIIGDTMAEPDETFTVTLSGAVNATIGRATGTGTIRNDDAPALTLSIAPGTITEGGAAAVGTVTRNSDTSSALIVQISSSDPTRVAVPASVTIPAASTSATFPITPIDNAIADGNETVTITISATGFNDDSANIVVNDDDTPALTLSIIPSTFSEAVGARAARGVVRRNTSKATPLTVTLSSSDTNKVSVPASVTIVAGSDNVAFVVGAVDDKVSDGDHRVVVTASAANFTSGTQTVTVTVTDNDSATTGESSVVSNTNDSGLGSLRSALDFANSKPGTTISFRIPPSDAGFKNGVWQIRLRQPLPPITAARTIIDGNTQTSAASNTNRRGPEILLDGSALPTSSGVGADGLQIRSFGCGIRGLIISGFGGSGVDMSGTVASGNTLQGNYIGTDPTGTLKASNGTSVLQSAGVRIAGGAHDNLIGGAGTSARNVIAGNTFDGVLITGAGSNNNRVQSNYIGTNANGSSALANGSAGVHLDGGAKNNLIGGPNPAVRNVISGNTFDGILLNGNGTNNNSIQGNYIGLNAAGNDDVGNLLHGVDMQGGQNNVVGTGTATLSARAGATTNGNVITFNGADGVHVDDTAQGVSIRGNLIYENDALGINLAAETDLSNGVTLNDTGDGDSGPNGLQNFPIITNVQPSKTSSGVVTTLIGTLNSTPNQNFVIDFYRSDQGNDSGYGEGGFYLGSTLVRTNGAGNAAFRFNASGNLSGQIFTATATSLPAGNTSEFGPAALQISGFEPGSGPVGTAVTIRGVGFRGVTNVFFNGIASTFSNDSLTQITAIVPANATSGPIRVTAPTGQTQSAENFTVLARPANDDFERAQVLADTNGSVSGTNINATAQPGEPDHAGNTAERSVWYRWTAPTSGIAIFDTQDSTFDTVLAVYTGTAVNALQLIAEDDDGGMADDSRVRFRTVAGQTYSIAVDGYEGDQGALVLSYALTPVRPPNDNFARAEVLNGARGNVDGSNLGATKEAGEPDHAGDSGGHSVWYRWTAPDNGTATFDTQGSDFDTLLAVYIGNSVDALRLIAENDDGADGFNSILSFEARRGQTYTIAVDGYDGDEGIIALNYALGSSGGGIIRWARPVSGNWNNPDNWAPADGRKRVPGPGDLAIIDVDGTYTVNLDIDITVSGLNLGARSGQQVLAIRNNTLTLDGRSRVSANGVLDLGGSSLTVQSDLFIGGLLRWSAGQLRGGGTLQVERAGTVSIEGSAAKLLSISSVRSFGTTKWTGSGDIIAGNGTIFLNYGNFSILNDATISWDGIGDVPAIFNYNTFTKSQAIGVTLFSGVELDNQARGFVRSGILRLRGGGTSYGNFDIVTGSRLEFTSAYFFAKESSNFSGGGDAVLIDGTFTIDTSGKPVTVSNFQLENGFIFGASEQSTLNAESFVWTGGGMRGKGATNVSGDLNIGGTNNKVLSGRALNNNGRAEWSGSGDIVGSEGALFDNNGTLNTGDEQDFTFDSGDPNTFNNDGTLNIGDAPETAPVNVRRDLQPRAGIALPTGIFNMFGSYNQAAAGILNLDIGGTTPGATYDQLNVNGPASLNGTLNVRLGNDFTPQNGDVFRVVGYQARQGTFNINISNLPPGITLEPVYTPNALELRVASGTNPPPGISKIEGRITRLNGDAFPNVRVELSDQNGKIVVAQTGADGQYRFSDVPNGRYTITPQAAGFEWNPPTRSLQLSQSSTISGADFIGLRAPSISGRLINSSGAGIPNVTMRLTRSGGGAAVTAQSNSNGYYGFEALEAGTYGVVPSMNGVLFSPPFLPATVSATKGVGNVNFLGTPFGSNAQLASVSPVKISSASANASQILLKFTGSLDSDSATDTDHYAVTVNDRAIEVESVEYRGAKNSVMLNLAANQLRSGEVASVRWQNLRDSKLQVLAGGTTARVR